MRQIIMFCLVSLLVTSQVKAQTEAPAETQKNTQETIKHMLDGVREKTGVKGIAVGIIERGKAPVFISSGVANLDNNTPITELTQFRFGSVAKALIAMSVMKLVEQGKLTLQTPVRDLAAEIHFANPYEATYPLTVQHLLNHTTGWDAMHFAENIVPSANPITIKQALDIHPDSRTSRWAPGSRTAYNNTGPLVAAYIVEKLSGMSFESFVKAHFLTPLNMANTDYFYTDNYRNNAATLYLGNIPLAYEHLNNRAAGAINSNIKDMSAFVAFLLSQGGSPQQTLLLPTSFHTMQTPTGSLPTEAGLEVTYALGLNLFHANGQVLFGHEGSVRGGSALIAYQPERQKGYVIAINGEGPAVAQVHHFLANLIIKPEATVIQSQPPRFSTSQQALSGFYRSINPTASLTAPFTALLPWKLNVTEQAATISPLLAAKPRQLGAKDEHRFSQWLTGKTVLVHASDPVAGAVIHYGPTTLQHISALAAFTPLVILAAWALAIVSAIGFAVIWLPRYWLGKMPSQASIRLRSWPLFSVVLLFIALGLVVFVKASPTLTELVGKPSWVSIGLMITSIMFFVSSMWSLVIWWHTPRLQVNVLAYWHSTLLIALNSLVALYLLYNGLIGVRLWA